MSISPLEFRSWLDSQLAGLSLPEKMHVIQRIYEKLRLIHNAVGAVYRQEKTINEFKTEYPEVFDKIKVELQQYIVDGYLNQEGWNYFCDNMFNPRHDSITQVMCEIRYALRATPSIKELEAF